MTFSYGLILTGTLAGLKSEYFLSANLSEKDDRIFTAERTQPSSMCQKCHLAAQGENFDDLVVNFSSFSARKKRKSVG